MAFIGMLCLKIYYGLLLKQHLPRTPEAVAQRCSVKKVFLEISHNSQENTCARVSFLSKFRPQTCNFIKKKILVQVFSCEFFEISKNTYSYRTPPVAASGTQENLERYCLEHRCERSLKLCDCFVNVQGCGMHWYLS